MPAPVPRQKGDANALERPDDEVVRRFAERGFDADLSNVSQPIHLVQTAAANDSDLRFFHIRHSRLFVSLRIDVARASALSAAEAGDAVAIQTGDVEDEVLRRNDRELQSQVFMRALHFLLKLLRLVVFKSSGVNQDVAGVNLFAGFLLRLRRRGRGRIGRVLGHAAILNADDVVSESRFDQFVRGWPFCKAKAAASKGGSIMPLPNQPRSPPFCLLPGSSLNSDASFSKLSPFFTRSSSPWAFSFSLSGSTFGFSARYFFFSASVSWFFSSSSELNRDARRLALLNFRAVMNFRSFSTPAWRAFSARSFISLHPTRCCSFRPSVTGCLLSEEVNLKSSSNRSLCEA